MHIPPSAQSRAHSRRHIRFATLGTALLAASCGRDAGNHPELPPHAIAAAMVTGAAAFSGKVPRLTDEPPVAHATGMVREFGDSATAGLLTAVRPIGRYLIAIDRFTSPHVLVFDRATGALLDRFGRDGQGPGEFRDPSTIFVISHDPAEFWIYDFDNVRATHVAVDAAGKAHVRSEVRLNPGHALETPIWLGGQIVANGLFSGFSLLVMDGEGNPQKRIDADAPHAAELGHLQGALQANRSFIATSPRRDRFALAYQFASRLDFFTAGLERYGTVAGPRPTQIRYRTVGNRFHWEDGNEVAYWGIDATDQYVFAAFCGCPVVTGEELPQRLHVFRWNGDFVGEVALERPLAAFSVSPDGSRLYGAFLEPYPAIGEWALPSAFHSPPTRS